MCYALLVKITAKWDGAIAFCNARKTEKTMLQSISEEEFGAWTAGDALVAVHRILKEESKANSNFRRSCECGEADRVLESIVQLLIDSSIQFPTQFQMQPSGFRHESWEMANDLTVVQNCDAFPNFVSDVNFERDFFFNHGIKIRFSFVDEDDFREDILKFFHIWNIGQPPEIKTEMFMIKASIYNFYG